MLKEENPIPFNLNVLWNTEISCISKGVVALDIQIHFFCLITRKKKQLKYCISPKCVALCWKSRPLQTALKCSFLYFILFCFPEPLCWLWYCVEFVSVLCCTNNLTHSRILMWFVVLMTGSVLCWNARKSVEMTLLWNCLLPFVDTRCHPWACLRSLLQSCCNLVSCSQMTSSESLVLFVSSYVLLRYLMRTGCCFLSSV